jgi:MoaA/NifB/PqqE/SkfB family radical SAM enzyme
MSPMVGRLARTAYRLFFTPYLTPRRIFNQVLLDVHERFRWDYIHAYPETVLVETTNACNSTCRLCPVGEGRRTRKVTALDAELFGRFIDDVAPYTQKVHFQNWGEPLLDKRLCDRIQYAHSKGLYTYVATTLHHLPRDGADRLVASGLNELSVSLHAASAESYQAYQPGRTFERVLQNIKEVVDARRRAARNEPQITLHFVRSRKNEHELARLPDMLAATGADDFVVSEVSINARFLWSDERMLDRHLDEEAFQREVNERAEEWLPDDRLKDWDRSNPPAAKLRSCDRLWRVGILNSDGTVPPCCDVFRSENNFDRYEPGRRFGDVWNNVLFRTARRSFRSPRQGDRLLVCTHCPGHAAQNKGRNPVRF